MPQSNKLLKVIRDNKTGILIVSVLTAAFLASRLYNILGIPMFNDEAIYIRWAEIFTLNPTQPFTSLVDGKQPSFIWLMGGFLKFVGDPLLAGRLASVLTGAIATVGMFFLGKELFNSKKVGLAAAVLYLIYPYTLLYDRMALYDSMLAMFAIWTLYLEVLLVRRRTYKLALITGLVIGGGMITKSGALFFLYLLPFSLLLFPFKERRWWRDQDLWQWGRCVLAVGVVTMAVYSLLRLSSNFENIALKNSEFTLTIGQWLQHPFSQLLAGSLGTLWGFVIGYSTWSFLLLVALAFVIKRNANKEKLLLLLWAVLPFLAFALFAKLIYPRYILFMLMPLIVLAAYGATAIMEKVRNKYLGFLVVFLLCIPMLRSDFYIVTDFSKAPVPELDKYAYIEGFYSGVGVTDVVEILENKSQNQKIYVATQGGFGIMPYSLQNYLYKNDNIMIESFAGIGSQPPTQVADAIKKYPTYHVFHAPCDTCEFIGVAPKSWNVREIYRVKRIEDNSYLTLVEVLPPTEPVQTP